MSKVNFAFSYIAGYAACFYSRPEFMYEFGLGRQLFIFLLMIIVIVAGCNVLAILLKTNNTLDEWRENDRRGTKD